MHDEFEAVLAAAQAGAEWAWARLYHDLAGPLLGYLRMQGAHEPDDLLGEVFVQLARNLIRFDGGEREFRSWAFTVAHHRVVDERRRRRRHPVDPADLGDDHVAAGGDTTAADAIERVRTDEIRRMVLSLPPAQRDVLMLRLVAGFTIAEIAAATSRSAGAVKALQRRGLAAIARRLPERGISP